MNIFEKSTDATREYKKMVAQELIDETTIRNNFKREAVAKLNEMVLMIAKEVRESEEMAVEQRTVQRHFFKKYYDSDIAIKKRLDKIFLGDLFGKNILDMNKIGLKESAKKYLVKVAEGQETREKEDVMNPVEEEQR